MASSKDKKNAEGYADPTAYEALRNIEREEARVKKLKKALSDIAELSGYHLKGQVSLVDKRTGRTYRI